VIGLKFDDRMMAIVTKRVAKSKRNSGNIGGLRGCDSSKYCIEEVAESIGGCMPYFNELSISMRQTM